MNTFWKKAGWTALTILPMIVSLGAQLLIGVVSVLAVAVIAGIQSAAAGMSEIEMELYVMEHAMDGVTVGILIYHILALIGFGIWYYFGCGRPKPVSPVRIFKGKCIPVTIIMGLGMCIGANALLSAAQYVVPGLIQDYTELMEAAGLGTDPLTIFASVLIAPVGEEILCRGITFHYAGKVVQGMKNRKAAFWIANVLQALMFGIMHGNLVQGFYAFLMGLCLGWLRYRYRSLYPAMLAHLVVNFTSTYLAEFMFGFIPDTLPFYLIVVAVSAAVIAALMFWDRSEKEALA